MLRTRRRTTHGALTLLLSVLLAATLQGVSTFRRRSLLATTYLSNVADVTMEMNTGSTSAVSGVNTSVVDAVADGTLAVSSCWKQLP